MEGVLQSARDFIQVVFVWRVENFRRFSNKIFLWISVHLGGAVIYVKEIAINILNIDCIMNTVE